MPNKEERCVIGENFYSEWVLSNRLGGYALGPGNLINTRKYHGLLVASRQNLKRLHLVSAVEERIGVKGEFMNIDSNSYIDTIYPDGYTHLVRSWLRPYPVFLYSSCPFSEHILILKELLMDEERNVTLLRYTNLGTVPLRFSFRYKFTLRDHHHVNQPGMFDRVSVSYEAFEDDGCAGGWVMRADNGAKAYVFVTSGRLKEELVIYRKVFYSREANRGYDALEDLIAPFLHEGHLAPGQCVDAFLSDRSLTEGLSALQGRDSGGSACSQDVIDASRSMICGRYRPYPLPEGHPRTVLPAPPETDPDVAQRLPYLWRESLLTFTGPAADGFIPEVSYRKILDLMLDDFRLDRELVAGFPWFSAWGRDTMIALQAFTGRKGFTDYVYGILEAYGERMRGGIIPNMIGEGGDGTNYDTVDASLWYVLRVFECFDEFEARKRKTLFSFCGEIVLSYLMSNDLAFFCDRRDGLVELRRGTNLALTWMDAKIYGVPVTPRYGKPVEVNGLWYNAVKAVIDMAGKIGADSLRRGGNFLRQKGSGTRSPADGKKPGPLSERSLTLTELEALAVEIRESMGKFFHEGTWCDRIEEGTPVSEIRPNYVIALSLPFDFTDREGIQRGLDCAREHLLTPYGLRSLARNSPMFRRKYVGNQKMRDLAYHQGTVWTWLLLPYAQLLRKLTDDRVKLKEALEELVFPLRCAVRKGVLVSLPEVWDGEDPAVPKGAPAQAWSVAALHFIERMIESC